MSSAPTIETLLLRWEELRAAGQELTAEELCGDHPELLSEVRRRLVALRAVYGVLDTAILLPDSTGKGAGPGGRDLGPDVDLGGPGPAYEYWKKTPGYQQWLQDTGQAR